jgi:AcrR family transcriptional regulator
VRLIAERGAEHLHYDEIARTAGVNRATVHRNWPNRDDLVLEALATFAEASIQLPETDDIEADLTDFVCTMAATARTAIGRALGRALLSNESSEFRRIGLRLLDERLPALQARIDRAVRSGDLPPVEAAFVNELLTGPVQLHVARHPGAFERRDAQRIVAVVLAGLRHWGSCRR